MVAEVTTAIPRSPQPNLTLRLSERDRHSFVSRQYAAYPLRLSRSLPLDRSDPHRVYLYMMNASPGLLAGDNLRVELEMDADTSLYLTDQSATKVHSMPVGTTAKVSYDISVGVKAYLEWVPEPLILYADSALEQRVQITLHPGSQICLSEIILPGRLARNEYYCFRHYFSRLQVNLKGELLFADAMRLEGKTNPFKDTVFLAALPAIANLIIVLPEIDLEPLSAALESQAEAQPNLRVGNSFLPRCNGLLVRAIADSTSTLKAYIRYTLNCVRRLSGQPQLPEIPK